MTPPAMLDNILAQPASHRAVLALHQGGGQANLRACGGKIRNGQGRVIVIGMGGSLFAAVPAVSRLQQQAFSRRRLRAQNYCTTAARICAPQIWA